jgi:hypothetical protein
LTTFPDWRAPNSEDAVSKSDRICLKRFPICLDDLNKKIWVLNKNQTWDLDPLERILLGLSGVSLSRFVWFNWRNRHWNFSLVLS